MVKKQIQKHNFLTGGPVIQYEIPFEDGTLGFNTITPDNNLTIEFMDLNPGITVNNRIGDIIFTATENQLQWVGSDIPTEERVREIFREEYYNILREIEHF